MNPRRRRHNKRARALRRLLVHGVRDVLWYILKGEETKAALVKWIPRP